MRRRKGEMTRGEVTDMVLDNMKDGASFEQAYSVVWNKFTGTKGRNPVPKVEGTGRHNGARKTALELLTHKAGQEFTPMQLQHATGMAYSTASKALADLKAVGAIQGQTKHQHASYWVAA